MNIRAKGKLDFRTHKALQKAHMGIIYYIGIAMIGLSIAEFCFELLSRGAAEGFKTAWLFLAAAAYWALLVFGIPRLTYKKLGRLKDSVSEYAFGDAGLTAYMSKDGIKQQAEISYDIIEKVIETREFFFIYQTKNTAFYVDKKTLEGGTAEDIRAKFAPRLGKKYIVRKR